MLRLLKKLRKPATVLALLLQLNRQAPRWQRNHSQHQLLRTMVKSELSKRRHPQHPVHSRWLSRKASHRRCPPCGPIAMTWAKVTRSIHQSLTFGDVWRLRFVTAYKSLSVCTLCELQTLVSSQPRKLRQWQLRGRHRRMVSRPRPHLRRKSQQACRSSRQCHKYQQCRRCQLSQGLVVQGL